MEVILLDKIGHLGGLGDKVKVRNGYARNYLLPQKKAVMANKENLAKFEEQRAQLEAKIAAELQAAQDRAAALRRLPPLPSPLRPVTKASCSALLVLAISPRP